MKKWISLISLAISVTVQPLSANAKEDVKTVEVVISEKGFAPASIEANKGENLTLMITRTTDKTCMKELKKLDGSGQVDLPLNQPVSFSVGKLEKSGQIKLLCGMDMTAGVVKVL